MKNETFYNTMDIFNWDFSSSIVKSQDEIMDPYLFYCLADDFHYVPTQSFLPLSPGSSTTSDCSDQSIHLSYFQDDNNLKAFPMKKSKYPLEQQKRFVCNHCSRAFARKHDSERHARIHTGEKPYSCPCCQKSFARSDALKRHIQKETKCRTSEQVLFWKKSGKRKTSSF
ncbi:hypothetical protein BY458DRAFT_523720 [Sporodiniella umbellata]|nr:hypothetical protein BY458DRAFT_523720 [Sporodiniella umbellata]